jgi:hypothetical protein
MQDIRIWFGSLVSYNNGMLCGEWIDLPICEDKLNAIYNRYTADGRSDYFIADFEAPFDIRESSDIFKVNAFVSELQRLSDYDQEKAIHLLNEGEDFESALDKLDDVIIYDCRTYEELAERQLEDGYFGPIPEALESYIDVSAIARNLKYSGAFEHTKSGFIAERVW